MDKKSQTGEIFVALLIVVVLTVMTFFATAWDSGVMTGKIIGYDGNMFGTRTVFVLEDRTIFGESGGLSQSQVELCTDKDDVEIHKMIEDNINKKVKIEYKERRVGFYGLSKCHDAPITSIIPFDGNNTN